MTGDVSEPVFEQRFVKTRFGWRIHTTRPGDGDGMALETEPAPFAFTRAGAEAKGARIVEDMLRVPATSFTVRYDARGRKIPPPPPPRPPARPGGNIGGLC